MGIGEVRLQCREGIDVNTSSSVFLGLVLMPQFPNHHRESRGASIREGR